MDPNANTSDDTDTDTAAAQAKRTSWVYLANASLLAAGCLANAVNVVGHEVNHDASLFSGGLPFLGMLVLGGASVWLLGQAIISGVSASVLEGQAAARPSRK